MLLLFLANSSLRLQKYYFMPLKQYISHFCQQKNRLVEKRFWKYSLKLVFCLLCCRVYHNAGWFLELGALFMLEWFKGQGRLAYQTKTTYLWNGQVQGRDWKAANVEIKNFERPSEILKNYCSRQEIKHYSRLSQLPVVLNTAFGHRFSHNSHRKMKD